MTRLHNAQRKVVPILFVVLGVLFFGMIWPVPTASGDGGERGGLSGEELQAVAPLLKRYGVVGLSEANGDGSPRAVTLVLRINAPRFYPCLHGHRRSRPGSLSHSQRCPHDPCRPQGLVRCRDASPSDQEAVNPFGHQAPIGNLAVGSTGQSMVVPR